MMTVKGVLLVQEQEDTVAHNRMVLPSSFDFVSLCLYASLFLDRVG